MTEPLPYKRILVKISGEGLMGSSPYGIHNETLVKIAQDIKHVVASGRQVSLVIGRMRKYYEEVVLLEQAYIMDDKSKVGQVIEKAAKEIGAPVKVLAFVRFQLGEGVEKQQSDFAAEVAAAAGHAA